MSLSLGIPYCYYYYILIPALSQSPGIYYIVRDFMVL